MSFLYNNVLSLFSYPKFSYRSYFIPRDGFHLQWFNNNVAYIDFFLSYKSIHQVFDIINWRKITYYCWISIFIAISFHVWWRSFSTSGIKASLCTQLLCLSCSLFCREIPRTEYYKPSAYFSFVNGIFSKCFIYITVIIRTALFPSLN